MDVEDNTQRPPPNPYSGQQQAPPSMDSIYLFRMKRILYMAISLYGLQHFKFYGVVLRSPHVRHAWFKMGLATAIAMAMIKAYIELYEGHLKKSKVNYKNYPQTTHAVLVLWCATALSFCISLWPHYGWNTPILLSILGFGVVLQFLLLVTNTYVQNALLFCGLTFFLQEYA